MESEDPLPDISTDISTNKRIEVALSSIFSSEIIEQANLLDAAELNLTDQMTSEIAKGIKKLKSLKHDTDQQREWLAEQQPGTRLLLCLWVKDMELASKILGIDIE